MATRDLYTLKLKEAHLSNTKARLAVFNALLNSDHKPLTINELVSKTRGRADRASVYRSVESLEKAGIIKRLNIGWKYKLELSDDFHGHHHHLTCTNCGSTIAVHEDEFEGIVDKIAGKHGYKMTDHQLDIRGLCPLCSKL